MRWLFNRVTVVYAIIFFISFLALFVAVQVWHSPEVATYLAVGTAIAAFLFIGALGLRQSNAARRQLLESGESYVEVCKELQKHKKTNFREIAVTVGVGIGILAVGLVFLIYLHQFYGIRINTAFLVVPCAIAFEAARRLLAYFSKRRQSSLMGATGLILRSFAQERFRVTLGTGFWPVFGPTIETFVASLARPFGATVSIENPSAILPNFGPTTLGTEGNGSWQDAALELMVEADFILLIAGPGDGLQWELGEIVARQPLHKCVVVFPDGVSGASEEFADTLMREFQIKLSDFENKDQKVIGVTFHDAETGNVITGSESSAANFRYLFDIFFYGLLKRRALDAPSQK